MISLHSKRTSNRNTLVQVAAGTTPEVDGDSTLGSRLPGKVDSLASLGVQARSGNVERVGAVGIFLALSESKQGTGGDSQEDGCGETHVGEV